MSDDSETTPLEALRSALLAVLVDARETLQQQGSIAPTAYVLADLAGERFTMVSLAVRSAANRQQSLQRVRETIAEHGAPAVIWVMEAWRSMAGDQQPHVVAEIETQAGLIFRCEAAVGDDDNGDSDLDVAAAVQSMRHYTGAELFARAFTLSDPDEA